MQAFVGENVLSEEYVTWVNLRAILSIPGRNEEYRHDLLLYDFFKDKYFKDVLETV